MKLDNDIIRKCLEFRFKCQFDHICYQDIKICNYNNYGNVYKIKAKNSLGPAIWILPIDEYQKLNRNEKLKKLNNV